VAKGVDRRAPNVPLDRLCSKSVRHLDQWDLPALDSLGPLVAPSLHSGRHSPGPLGHLKPVDPSVSVSNYYVESLLVIFLGVHFH
jgi:hypothetical protein